MRRSLTALITAFLIITSSAQASMRCDKGIIGGGETIAEVIRKCGQPDNRDVIPPAVDSSGKPAYQSVTVENWVYGPRNGMYRYLKFIDGKLASINSDRG